MESTKEKKQWQAAEIKLSYKSNVKPSQRPKITSSKDAYLLLKQSWNESTIELIEEFKVILTNRASKVLGIYEAAIGGISGVCVDPKLIFIAALKAGATGIILSHNHPSGNLTPSEPDLALTRKIKEGCKWLDIAMLDHLILTSEEYYSFADVGLI